MSKYPLTPAQRCSILVSLLCLVGLVGSAFTPFGRRVAADYLPLGSHAVLRVLPNAPMAVLPPPMTVTVTDASDGTVTPGNCPGPTCRLRDAIAAVAAGGTINFDTAGVFASAQTIMLTQGELVINQDLTIQGTGASLLAVNGNLMSRIFSVPANVTLNLSGLTLTRGIGVGADENDKGGAMYINGAANLTACVVTANIANLVGGGLYCKGGTLTLTDCTVSNNAVKQFGGGIVCDNGGGATQNATLTILSSTISGNRSISPFSNNAGGILTVRTRLTMINSTVSGNALPNTSGSSGAGIWHGGDDATIINCTITNNSVESTNNTAGGMLKTTGNVYIRNTIIAGNVNNNTVPDVRGTAYTSLGNNLIGNVGSATSFTESTDQTGTGVTPLDPKLAPLANNGGPTFTHRPLPGSPALNQGENCVVSGMCASNNVSPLPYDQRGMGFARQVGSAVDIGALEAPAYGATCVAPPANMTAWFPADANANDIQSGNVGTLQGTATLDTSVVGRVGLGAFSFPGWSTAYVSSPDSSSLNVGTGDFSIDAWIKMNDADKAGIRTIQDKRSNVSTMPTGYHFFVNNDFLGLQLADGAGFTNYIASTGDVADGNWHHVAATVARNSPTGGRLYVDGGLVLTFNPTNRTGSLTNNAEFRIGGHSASGQAYFKGLIDEVELFARALSAGEVLALADASHIGQGKCYADLAITKDDSSLTAVAGSPLTYTITATNNGRSDVVGATVKDTLPPSLSSATWTCTGTPGTSCTPIDMGNINDTVTIPAGGSITYMLTATLDAMATGMLDNTATITAPSGVLELNTQNNSATDSDTILVPASATPLMSQSVCVGTKVTFSTTASGTGPFTFVWKKGTTPLMSGITTMGNTSMLMLTNVQVADSDTYTVEVMGAAGNTATQSATLAVNPPPTLTDPSDQIVLAGGTATFSVTPTGTPTPTVQWFLSTDGGSTFGTTPVGTGNTLTLMNVTTAMNGYRYRAVATNTCGMVTSQAAQLIVNTLKVEVGDPLLCLSANGLVGVTVTITNNHTASVNTDFTATLPTNLNGLPGTGLASLNPGGIVVATGSVTWMGTIPANTTVTLSYKAQLVGPVPTAPLCVDSTVSFNNSPLHHLQACAPLNCPTNPADVAVSDQKAGSLLVFPYYTSKAATKSDTRLTLSNLGNATTTVHLFFIDGATCQQADSFLCLTPNASFSFQASEYDAEATGWLLAVAVDKQGRPIQYNGLIGNAFVKDGDYVDNYGAEAFRANSPLVATINGNTATLFFDNQSYDAMPNRFAIEIQSPVDVAGQRVVTVGLSGDLTTGKLTGAGQVGTAQVINGNEKPFGSFNSWLLGNCQASALLSTTSPRVPNGLAGMIPTGQVGTIKLNIGAGVGLLMTPRTATWKGIRTLHKTGQTATALTIPIVVPVC